MCYVHFIVVLSVPHLAKKETFQCETLPLPLSTKLSLSPMDLPTHFQGPKPPVKAAPKPNLSKLAVPKSSVSDAKVPVVGGSCLSSLLPFQYLTV